MNSVLTNGHFPPRTLESHLLSFPRTGFLGIFPAQPQGKDKGQPVTGQMIAAPKWWVCPVRTCHPELAEGTAQGQDILCRETWALPEQPDTPPGRARETGRADGTGTRF